LSWWAVSPTIPARCNCGRTSGLPLWAAANAEASSIGAAMTTGIAGGSLAGAGEATAAMVRYADVIRPDPRHARTEKFAWWSASFGLRD
jgi:hypothetical protein